MAPMVLRSVLLPAVVEEEVPATLPQVGTQARARRARVIRLAVLAGRGRR